MFLFAVVLFSKELLELLSLRSLFLFANTDSLDWGLFEVPRELLLG